MPANKQKTGFRGPSPEVGKPHQWKKGQSGNASGRPKSKTLSDALPAAKLKIFDGLGHNPFWEDPAGVAAAINAFLEAKT